MLLRNFKIKSDLGGGLTKWRMSALPTRPSGWDIRLSSILDGDFNYFCGRKMLAYSWINWSSSGRCRGWDGLSWFSVLLAGFSLPFLLASLVFCILILCDFIWKFHMQRDITLFQTKLDCSYIGNIVEVQLGDNGKYFPDLIWVHISYFSLQCECMLESPSLLLWKVVLILFTELLPDDLFLSLITCTPFLVSLWVGWTLIQAWLPVVGGEGQCWVHSCCRPSFTLLLY